MKVHEKLKYDLIWINGPMRTYGCTGSNHNCITASLCIWHINIIVGWRSRDIKTSIYWCSFALLTHNHWWLLPGMHNNAICWVHFLKSSAWRLNNICPEWKSPSYDMKVDVDFTTLLKLSHVHVANSQALVQFYRAKFILNVTHEDFYLLWKHPHHCIILSLHF